MLNLLKNKKFRNWGLIAIVVTALLLAGQTFLPAKASVPTTNTEGKVVSLDVGETVEASGSLEAQPSATLRWKTSGVVENVNVKADEWVTAGSVLMTLKTTSVSSSIISAQADLVTAREELDDLLSSSDTDLAQAVIDLKDAQEEYDKAVDYLYYLQSSMKVPQTETRVSIRTRRNSWQYVYKTKTFKGPAPEDWLIEAENDLALKKGEWEEAQRTYELLKDGPNAKDVIAAQAKVDAAQATVDSMSVIAPFDGEVLYVESRPGDVVSAETSAINVANRDHLYIETQVDESDIAKIKVNAQATATLDAVPGVTLAGKVTAINPVGEVVSGLVKYTVRVHLDKVADDVFLPLGTTVNVVVQVKEATASLAVPISAIQNDSNGEFVWVVESDGSTARVDIVSGSIVGDLVVVSGDLREGARVSLLQASSFNAPNPFGGGN